jgi:hypothetical protein
MLQELPNVMGHANGGFVPLRDTQAKMHAGWNRPH